VTLEEFVEVPTEYNFKTRRSVVDTSMLEVRLNTIEQQITTAYNHVRTINEKWIGGPYTFLYHYTLCDECNKQLQSTQDKTMTNDSVRRSKNNKGIDPEMKE
jgi:hypothetical protein